MGSRPIRRCWSTYRFWTKPLLEMLPDIRDAIRSAESKLGKDGRVLVRYSGTEPLLRVMVEGRDPSVVHQLAKSIAEQARENLG